MLTREDLDMWLDLLIESRGWRSMGDQSRSIFLDQLNKYKPDPDKFGDHCAQMLDAERCQPNDIIRHFKLQYLESCRHLQLAPSSKPTRPTNGCDEHIRCLRAMRELREALATGKSYPMAAKPGQRPSAEWTELWQRPLTDEDRDLVNSGENPLQSMMAALGGGHG